MGPYLLRGASEVSQGLSSSCSDGVDSTFFPPCYSFMTHRNFILFRPRFTWQSAPTGSRTVRESAEKHL